jgi:hypothetical protein
MPNTRILSVPRTHVHGLEVGAPAFLFMRSLRPNHRRDRPVITPTDGGDVLGLALVNARLATICVSHDNDGDPRTAEAVRRTVDALLHSYVRFLGIVQSISTVDYIGNRTRIVVSEAGSVVGQRCPWMDTLPDAATNAVFRRPHLGSRTALAPMTPYGYAALLVSQYMYEEMIGMAHGGGAVVSITVPLTTSDVGVPNTTAVRVTRAQLVSLTFEAATDTAITTEIVGARDPDTFLCLQLVPAVAPPQKLVGITAAASDATGSGRLNMATTIPPLVNLVQDGRYGTPARPADPAGLAIALSVGDGLDVARDNEAAIIAALGGVDGPIFEALIRAIAAGVPGNDMAGTRTLYAIVQGAISGANILPGLARTILDVIYRGDPVNVMHPMMAGELAALYNAGGFRFTGAVMGDEEVIAWQPTPVGFYRAGYLRNLSHDVRKVSRPKLNEAWGAPHPRTGPSPVLSAGTYLDCRAAADDLRGSQVYALVVNDANLLVPAAGPVGAVVDVAADVVDVAAVPPVDMVTDVAADIAGASAMVVDAALPPLDSARGADAMGAPAGQKKRGKRRKTAATA